MSERLVASARTSVGRELAVLTGRDQKLRAVGEEFRRAAFVGLDMRRRRADHAVIGLAQRGQRQRIGRGAVEGEEHLGIGFRKQLPERIRGALRPGIVAIGGRVAIDWPPPSPPMPRGKCRRNCRSRIVGGRGSSQKSPSSWVPGAATRRRLQPRSSELSSRLIIKPPGGAIDPSAMSARSINSATVGTKNPS